MDYVYSPRRAGLKAAVILAAVSTLTYAGMIVLVSRRPARSVDLAPLSSVPSSDPAIIATVPYAVTSHTQLGENLVPGVTLPVTINSKTHSQSFLIDTGALITTIPSSSAVTYALDLESLPRLTLSSLTAQTVFGYLTPATLLFNTHEITLPVAFAAVDTALLGRQGFLDRYTLTFDHQNRQVIISTN